MSHNVADRSSRASPVGIVCPIATPVDASGRFAKERLAEHIVRLAPFIDGLFVLGSSGELASLPQDAIRDVIECASVSVPADVCLYVGVGDASTPRVVDRLEALSPRTDFAVVCGPYYFAAVSQSSLYNHFAVAADRSPCPVVLYNLPQNVGSLLEAATLAELAQHPNIAGVKDSSGDMISFLSMIDVAPDGFSVMQGREQLAAASLAAGARGIVSALANFWPQPLRSLVEAVGAGEYGDANALQTEIAKAGRLFDQGHWVAALKAALCELGVDFGDPVPPLPACTSAQKEAIRAILSDCDVPVLVPRPSATPLR